MVELRARQRTFHGAYSRTALGNLGYALTIVRLFDHRFLHSKSTRSESSPRPHYLQTNINASSPSPLVGLLFGVLAGMLFILAFLRARHSRHDFADRPTNGKSMEDYEPPVITVGQKRDRIFGRPFITAGWIVVAVTLAVLAAEVGLLVMVLRL